MLTLCLPILYTNFAGITMWYALRDLYLQTKLLKFFNSSLYQRAKEGNSHISNLSSTNQAHTIICHGNFVGSCIVFLAVWLCHFCDLSYNIKSNQLSIQWALSLSPYLQTRSQHCSRKKTTEIQYGYPVKTWIIPLNLLSTY